MPTQSITVERFESAQAVAVQASRCILDAGARAIAARGRFNLVLAGGRTPIAAYTLLVDQRADWEHWHIFLGDERCLPAHDPERNSVCAAHAFWDKVSIPARNLHLIQADLGAEESALAYATEIEPVLPFDLVLLGMGEDGHTASLFPGHPVPSEALVIPVHDAPKPPPERVSMTPRALAASREMLILITGSGKREAMDAWAGGADLPVVRVASMGSAMVLADQDALGPTQEFMLPVIV